MSRVSSVANWLLRSPLLWGSLLSLTFYATLRTSGASWPWLNRYFDSHIVEWVSTQLFCVALAALGLRLLSLAGQSAALKIDALGATPAGAQPPSDASDLLRRLDRLPETLQDTYYVTRLRNGLEYVRDTDSADGLEEHLKRLEDLELEQMSAGYALPRLVRATLPIVGMLGTVIGITLAIEKLSPDQLEQSLTSVMSALSVAFDTTAQAMSLMLVLWLAIFGAERVEQRLLVRVDRAVSRELIGRFQVYGASTDPSVASIRRMGEQVVVAVEQLALKQSEAWRDAGDEVAAAAERMTNKQAEVLRAAVEATQDRWTESAVKAGEALKDALEQGVSESVQDHATRLNAGAERLLGGLGAGVERMAESMADSLRAHGETLTEAERQIAAENRQHLAEVEAAVGEAMVVASDRQENLIARSERLLETIHEALAASTGASVEHHEQLIRQSDVLLRVVESTGEVQRLEDSLNSNLAALGRERHFEETLVSLSAAIQLLTAKLAREGGDGSSVGKAA